MKLAFAMGNIEITYTNKNLSETIRTMIPSLDIMAQYTDKYKPLIIYGTKRKRARKESK